MKQYDSYKDSGVQWIGEIPSNWGMRKMKYDFHIYAGATPKTENANYWDGNVVWITPADYKTNDKYVSEGQRTITEEGYNSCNTQLVPKGSLIFSKRAPIGTVAISSVDLCTNQGCLSCVPKDVNTLFFYYLTSVITEIFDLLGSGATFREISADAFANIKLPLPSLPEQQAIATYLDKKCAGIDKTIATQQKRIELLQELRQNIITHAVTRGINPDAPLKDTGEEWIGMVPKHWEVSRLKFYGSIKSGDGINNEVIDKQGTYEVYGGNGLMGYTETYNVETDKIIIGRVGALCGNIHVSRGKRFISDNALVFSPNNKADFNYLVVVMDVAKLNQLNTSSAQPLITGTKVSNVKIPVPPLNEQEAIVDYIESATAKLDKQVAKANRQISLLQELKQSIITEVVTGKRKVC